MDSKTMEYFERKLKEARLISQGEAVDTELLNREEVERYLVVLAREGDQKAIEYLFKKYKSLVYSKAKPYFLKGAEKDDILQEGMIGLHKAIRDFDEEKNILFRYFAELCIHRQVITAIKGSGRQKHIPLNQYISLYRPAFEEESDLILIDTVENNLFLNPEDSILNKENYEHIKKLMKQLLSSLEEKVITMYLEGISYQGIADELGLDIKQIDNALQRAKRKFEKYFMGRKEKHL